MRCSLPKQSTELRFSVYLLLSILSINAIQRRYWILLGNRSFIHPSPISFTRYFWHDCLSIRIVQAADRSVDGLKCNSRIAREMAWKSTKRASAKPRWLFVDGSRRLSGWLLEDCLWEVRENNNFTETDWEKWYFRLLGSDSETKKRSLSSFSRLSSISIGIVPPIFVDSLLNETNPSPWLVVESNFG